MSFNLRKPHLSVWTTPLNAIVEEDADHQQPNTAPVQNTLHLLLRISLPHRLFMNLYGKWPQALSKQSRFWAAK